MKKFASEILCVVWVLLAVAIKIGAQETLTELEQAKVELLQVRTAYARLLAQHDGCKAELGTTFNELGRLRAAAASRELTDEEARLKAYVESQHEGWLFDPKTGSLTRKPPDTPKSTK